MKLLVLTVVLASLSSVVQSQSTSSAAQPFQTELARWRRQEAAAKQDVELTDSVLKAFFIATKPTTGAPISAIVNRALAQLRTRFPDYRLRYRSPIDYCPAVRAIQDARAAANTRIIQALYEQQRTLALSQAYNRVLIAMKANAILGQSTGENTIRSAFVAEPTESIEIATDWSSMDYLTDDYLSDPNCN